MPKLVSILIPVYNAEAFVAETIQSALDQTWPAKEIIAIDDGSTDKSLEILKSFAAAGVKVIEQQNRGASAARNRGLSEAKGEFIQYLDADDLMDANKIEIQMRRLNSEPPGRVAAGGWGRFYDSPQMTQFEPEAVWASLPPVDWIIASWLGGGMMPCQAWLTPRSVADAAGLWDETPCPNDDGEYFTRVLLKSSGVSFCEDARVYYRSGLSQSWSRGSQRNSAASVYRSLELCASYLLAREDSERTRAACAAQFQRFIYGVFPNSPDLVRRAEGKVKEFGGSDLKPGGGQLFQLTSKTLGWKTAKRVQKAVRS
jgi:glycosyltransferase involved in cell wall biosynthesis